MEIKTPLTEEQLANKSKYCSNGNNPCCDICIGLRTVETGETRFSGCEKYIADNYTFMGVTCPTTMLKYRHPPDFGSDSEPEGGKYVEKY